MSIILCDSLDFRAGWRGLSPWKPESTVTRAALRYVELMPQGRVRLGVPNRRRPGLGAPCMRADQPRQTRQADTAELGCGFAQAFPAPSGPRQHLVDGFKPAKPMHDEQQLVQALTPVERARLSLLVQHR